MATLTPAEEAEGATRTRAGLIFARRRFQLISALLIAALLPYLIQRSIFTAAIPQATTVAFAANATAVMIAFWMRLSIEVYPGIRRSYVIVPSVLAATCVTFAALLALRLPYGRTSLILSVILHIGWLYLIYVIVERRVQRRIAVVPSGDFRQLIGIPNVEWRLLKRPRLSDARSCDAIVADFSESLADEWEAFLAEAALAGRIVYQRKQLSESLTGRVELEHLSENTFGLLVPSRAYFYVKTCIDFVAAVVAVLAVLPIILVIALFIVGEDGRSPLFIQERVGHAGRTFRMYKFRTMRPFAFDDERVAATTLDYDDRITRVGRVLRKYRLDELPQILNILSLDMSWIGPRPEAKVLSAWYRNEIPFYDYRHVVKPGISGWAQVNQGHVAAVDEVHEKLQYDFYYIKYFSPWLDLLILLRTIKAMMTGFGSR